MITLWKKIDQIKELFPALNSKKIRTVLKIHRDLNDAILFILKNQDNLIDNEMSSDEKILVDTPPSKKRKIESEDEPKMTCDCCVDKTGIHFCSEKKHSFCADCLNKYVSYCVFEASKTQLACFESNGDCNGEIPYKELQVLPEKLLQKYDELMVHNVNNEIIRYCFACHTPVVLSKYIQVFYCSCRTMNCTKCCKVYDKDHICDDERKSFNSIATKMSESYIRKCMKCSKPFVKESGCNMIACSCSAKICYVCKKDISEDGYRHFCNDLHFDHNKKCNSCHLYEYDLHKKDEEIMLNVLENEVSSMNDQHKDVIKKRLSDIHK